MRTQSSAPLSKKWKDLSNVQKANLAVTFGGIRRYADFIALMDNYEVKLAATIISQRASSEAIEANQLIICYWISCRERVPQLNNIPISI